MADPAIPLLTTKLHAPRRRDVVARPRLRVRLDRRDPPALTLVSAAAGFGKTTLVAEWVADAPVTAWLSLDSHDDDPALFWTYVVAAIQVPLPDVGTMARTMLDAASPSIDAVVTTLLNELHAAPEGLVLVVDDYHVVESPEIHESMAFLLDHLPDQVRVVIATRSDPPLPLATLRARGELVEIRAADLRFTTEEAATYLSDAMDLTVAPSDVEALDARTEGWIAALQLAALSMQGREDVAEFVAGFAGDDRFVLDYLVGEVLDRQEPDVRAFLLDTSILNRLTGPLCDAVTGQSGGRATLERLERANLFLIPLDDRRTWFRYHHLFADVLRARQLDEDAEHVRELHRRAADWYGANGEEAEAIAHAMAGGDPERAADLIELVAPVMHRHRREATIRAWLEALPSEVFRDRPVLTITLVGARMSTGDPIGVEPLLAQVEAALEPTAPTPIVRDHDAFRLLPAHLQMYHSALALLAGDLDLAVVHAARVLELTDPTDHLEQGASLALEGLALWAAGELDGAEARYIGSVRRFVDGDYLPDALGCSLALADLRIALGHLDDATRTFEDGLRWTAEHPGLRGAADMHVGLSEVLIDRGDLDAAEAHLRACADLGDHMGLPQNAYRRRVAAARLRHARGDLDGALELLDEAAPLYDTDFSPPVRPVSALRARVELDRGDVAAALRWAAERGLGPDDDLSYVREFEHVTLARALLAQHELDHDPRVLRDATDLLDRLLAAAEAGKRGSAAEIRTLVAAAAPPDDVAPAPTIAPLTMVEGLSPRELDVLRLLRSDLSGPDIARELYISLNTFRTHTKNLYAKLGVGTRREAVTRATELGL